MRSTIPAMAAAAITAAATATIKTTKPSRPRLLTALVLSTTHMLKTIKVRITSPAATKWHPVLRKPVAIRPKTVLVHDPAGSCVEGDVVNVIGGFRASKTVRHVVTKIVSPFGGKGIADRPAVVTLEELRRAKEEKLMRKRERKGRLPLFEEKG